MSNISEEQLIEQLSMSKNRVTPLEMTKYYNHRKIDFPKNKDGNPNIYGYIANSILFASSFYILIKLINNLMQNM